MLFLKAVQSKNKSVPIFLNRALLEIPVAGDIGIMAAALHDFHRDSADRLITATALHHGAQLVTADKRILNWPGALLRHVARQ